MNGYNSKFDFQNWSMNIHGNETLLFKSTFDLCRHDFRFPRTKEKIKFLIIHHINDYIRYKLRKLWTVISKDNDFKSTNERLLETRNLSFKMPLHSSWYDSRFSRFRRVKRSGNFYQYVKLLLLRNFITISARIAYSNLSLALCLTDLS